VTWGAVSSERRVNWTEEMEIRMEWKNLLGPAFLSLFLACLQVGRRMRYLQSMDEDVSASGF
jgi:hypothetical protein